MEAEENEKGPEIQNFENQERQDPGPEENVVKEDETEPKQDEFLVRRFIRKTRP